MAMALALERQAGQQFLRSWAGCSRLAVTQVRLPCGLQGRAAPSLLAPSLQRGVSSAASAKVGKIIQAELKHEEEQYEQAKEIKAFLDSSPFKLMDTAGDVNMVLEREVGDKVIRIEWQLTSPFNPEMEEEGEEAEQDMEATELTITAENKTSGAGVTFFCSTQNGEEHRYVIGNVKSFASTEERDGVSGYVGPDFEDLDDKLQESLDEYLAELGMSSEVCDFVDAVALDKEQREYVRWLKTTAAFLES